MAFLSLPYACSKQSSTPLTSPRRPRRPYGYWKEKENLSSELRAFAAENGEGWRMPTLAELLSAARGDLAGAIRRQGTWKRAADAAGLVLTSIVRPRSLYLSFCTPIRGARPNNYWRDFGNIRRELLAHIAKTKAGPSSGGAAPDARMLPSAAQLEAEQRSDLVRAIGLHGGFEAVASRLDLRVRYRSSRYWRDFANVERELLVFISEFGVEGVMPPVAIIRRFAPPGLHTAIEQMYGGSTVVARRIGLECMNPRRPRGYWKSRTNRLRELRAFVDFLKRNDPARDHSRMPTNMDMLRWGRADLAGGLTRYEGLSNAARLVGLRPNRAGEDDGYESNSLSLEVLD